MYSSEINTYGTASQKDCQMVSTRKVAKLKLVVASDLSHSTCEHVMIRYGSGGEPYVDWYKER